MVFDKIYFRIEILNFQNKWVLYFLYHYGDGLAVKISPGNEQAGYGSKFQSD